MDEKIEAVERKLRKIIEEEEREGKVEVSDIQINGREFKLVEETE